MSCRFCLPSRKRHLPPFWVISFSLSNDWSSLLKKSAFSSHFTLLYSLFDLVVSLLTTVIPALKIWFSLPRPWILISSLIHKLRPLSSRLSDLFKIDLNTCNIVPALNSSSSSARLSYSQNFAFSLLKLIVSVFGPSLKRHISSNSYVWNSLMKRSEHSSNLDSGLCSGERYCETWSEYMFISVSQSTLSS